MVKIQSDSLSASGSPSRRARFPQRRPDVGLAEFSTRLSAALLLSLSTALSVACLVPSARADDLPTFELVNAFSLVPKYSVIKAGDFNGDGYADMVIAQGGTFIVYLTDPAHPGTFLTPIQFSAPQSIYLEVVDINNDGRPDILAPHASPSQGLTTFLCNPPGSPSLFQPPVERSFVGLNLDFGDFNHDGWVDIIGAGRIYLNGGAANPGVFGGVSYDVRPGLAIDSPHAAVGDFNKDGWPDVAIVDGGATIWTHINNKNNTFTQLDALTSFDASSPPGTQLKSADFNGDGRGDIVTTTSGQSAFVGLFLAKLNSTPIDGRMQKILNLGGVGTPGQLSIADFNLDGAPDLLVSSSFTNNNTPVVMLLNSPPPLMGTVFRQIPMMGTLASAASHVVADFNGDGKPDIVTLTLAGQTTFSVWLNTTPTPTAPCPSDLNHDSVVDDADFVIFVQAYNQLLCE